MELTDYLRRLTKLYKWKKRFVKKSCMNGSHDKCTVFINCGKVIKQGELRRKILPHELFHFPAK